MKQLRKHIRLVALALIALFALTAAYSGYSIYTYGGRWFSSSYNPRVRAEKQNVIPGDILDRNGVLLATTSDGERVYQADETARRAVVHLLGDHSGNVSNGVESFQASYLLGFQASFLERVAQTLRGETRRGDNVTLTVDSKLSTYIAEIFPEGKSGAVVVLNYKTGETLSISSFPNFDPHTITDAVKDDPDKPFFNRAVQGLYAPGSTFKIITAASALANWPDAQTRSFLCTGNLTASNGTEMRAVTDAGGSVHGELTLRGAFVQSCNNTFAQVALTLGDETLKKTAAEFGFGDNFLFRDLVVENSSYPADNRSPLEIAWTGAGQSGLVCTPLHMCMAAAAVANDGVMMEPRLLKAVTSASQVSRLSFSSKVYRRAMSSEIAATLKSYMREVVTSGTGVQAYVPGLTVCGKTGSAQFSDLEEKRNLVHAWFAGFIDSDEFPYAIAVVVESAEGGGGSVAAPLAHKIFSFMAGKEP